MFAVFPTLEAVLSPRVRRFLQGGRAMALLTTALALPAPFLVGGCELLEPDRCRSGQEACPCRSDGSCLAGLSCLSGMCVDAPSSPASPVVTPTGVSPDVNPSMTSGAPVAPPPALSPSVAPSPDGVDPDVQPGGPGPVDVPNVAPTSSQPGGGVEPVPPVQPVDGDLTNTAVGKHGQLSVRGTELVDAHGNAIQLKGISSMWLNWDPVGYGESREGLRFMRDSWGLRIFRAAMGAALPPGNNEHDDTYTGNPAKAEAQVRTIVENAIALGVYVIIDWHDHDAHERREAAVDFFARMAQDYGSYPNVLYEVYNEPLAVDWDTVIKPYHEALVAAIRQHDPDNTIILGTPNWSQDVDVAASSPVTGSNLMYTLHFYSCTHDSGLRDKAEQALQSGLPLFVTEWGATHADGGVDGIVCDGEAAAWHDWMDARKISWTAWKLDGCTDSSCFFKDRSVPPDGGWTDEQLNGHASFVLGRLRTPGSGNDGGGASPPAGGNDGETSCAPSGACAAGDGLDCVNGQSVARECAGCEALSCGVACCERVVPLGADAEPFAARPELVQAFSQSAEGVQLSMTFGSGNEFGAVTFELTAPQSVIPDQVRVEAELSGEAIDPERLTVSLEDEAGGCHYPASRQDDAWLIDGPATACWNGFGAESPVSVINVRVDAQGSGSGALVVRGVTF